MDYFELMTIEAPKIQEELLPPSYWVQEFRKRAITRDNYKEYEQVCAGPGVGNSAGPVYSQSSLCPLVSAWHSKHLHTKDLLFPPSCKLSSSFMKSQIPNSLSLAQSGI